jgi:hypothetical protein
MVVCIGSSVTVLPPATGLQATPVVGVTPVLDESWLQAVQAIIRVDATNLAGRWQARLWPSAP